MNISKDQEVEFLKALIKELKREYFNLKMTLDYNTSILLKDRGDKAKHDLIHNQIKTKLPPLDKKLEYLELRLDLCQK